MADLPRRRNRREQWVLDVLKRSETPMDNNGNGTFGYRLQGRLAELLGHEDLEFTFQKRAARNGVELASPGSWVHDQLLHFAQEWGCVGRFYAPPLTDVDPLAVVCRRRNPGTPVECVERGYTLLLDFALRLSFYSEPPHEELVYIGWDQTQSRVLPRGVPRRFLTDADEMPRDELGPPPAVDAGKAFPFVWERLEEYVETKVHEIREEGRSRLDGDIDTLGRYYRQLIEEEKRLLKNRMGKRAQEEGAHRLDLLKLEWERRVKEETQRLEPQVVVRLAACAAVFLPVEKWAMNGGEEPFLWLDPRRGSSWVPQGPNQGV